MNKRSTRNWSLAILTVLILGIAFWWWQDLRGQKGEAAVRSPRAMINTTASEAKEEAAKMTMEVASTTIKNIKAGRIKSISQVVMKNPLPVKLTVDRLDYALLINDVKVAEGSYPQRIEIPASDSTTVFLPMYVMVKPMDAVIDKMDQEGKDTATYTFANTVYTNVPIAGERKISFNIKEELPIVRLPKMRIADIDINDVGLKNSGMKVTMEVTNRNSFPIQLEDGRYSMVIDDQTTMTGNMQEVVVLPAKQTVPVTMYTDMKTGRTMKMGWKLLFDKKDTRYRIKFDGKIRSESKLLKKSSVEFNEEGNLADLKKEVKKAQE
mgnify:CR=1 FL=1